MGNSYKESKLYKLLEKKQDALVSNLIDSDFVMPAIEMVLTKQAVLDPLKNFTLHDQDHAFRVAEKMYEVIPPESLNILSPLEVAFLLLSAYLHDIGMAPQNALIDKYFNYLLWEDSEGLTKNQIGELEYFIFEQFGDTPFPLKEQKLEKPIFSLANKIMMHFCRHMHNDWSEDWMRDKLMIVKAPFPGWLEALIDICKSHHFGYEALKNEKFDPIKGAGQVIHKRYLAMVLRIADVLENDPERTPEIILDHRNVIEESLIYWLKDHYMECSINDFQVSIFSQPDSAFIHKAVEETVKMIEQELALCSRLVAERPLSFHPPKNSLQHEWRLRPHIFKQITPLNNRYTYIDASFKNNSKRLIELLAGTHIYGDPLVALRELLQNAFDAVKEKMAHLRLTSSNSNDPGFVSSLRKMNRVEFTVEDINGKLWLSCHDTGIGMSREVIENNFLVNGSRKRASTYILERKCREAGFGLGRTGQFGIGALSYFMIADEIKIETRRNAIAEDSDHKTWNLTIPGLHGFGELVEQNNFIEGTKISLKLKSGIAKSVEQLTENVKREINHYCVRSPCVLSLKSAKMQDKWKVLPGWLISNENLEDDYFNHLTREEFHFSHNSSFKEIDAIKNSMRWLKEESYLPNGYGNYRLLIPYFEINGENTFCWMSGEKIESGFVLDNGGYFFPDSVFKISWNGMSVSSSHMGLINTNVPVFLFLDITDSRIGSISVSRKEIEFSEKHFSELKEFLDDRISDVITENISVFSNSPYSFFNFPVLEGGLSVEMVPEPWENRSIRLVKKSKEGLLSYIFGNSTDRSFFYSDGNSFFFRTFPDSLHGSFPFSGYYGAFDKLLLSEKVDFSNKLFFAGSFNFEPFEFGAVRDLPSSLSIPSALRNFTILKDNGSMIVNYGHRFFKRTNPWWQGGILSSWIEEILYESLASSDWLSFLSTVLNEMEDDAILIDYLDFLSVSNYVWKSASGKVDSLRLLPPRESNPVASQFYRVFEERRINELLHERIKDCENEILIASFSYNYYERRTEVDIYTLTPSGVTKSQIDYSELLNKIPENFRFTPPQY